MREVREVREVRVDNVQNPIAVVFSRFPKPLSCDATVTVLCEQWFEKGYYV